MPSANPKTAKAAPNIYMLGDNPAAIGATAIPRQQSINIRLSPMRSARNPAGKAVNPKVKPKILASTPKTKEAGTKLLGDTYQNSPIGLFKDMDHSVAG